MLSMPLDRYRKLSYILCDHKTDHMSDWVGCSGKALETPKRRHVDSIWETGGYWELGTGSPGAAGWKWLLTTIVNREATASVERGYKD